MILVLLLRRVVLSSVHCPDDDDLLQALGRGRRGPQLLHQSVEGVRVDGLLLVGVEGHLVCGGDGLVGGLRLEALDDGGAGGGGGVGVRGRTRGFGVGGGRLGVGRLALWDGPQTFVLLGEFALDEGHGVAGGQEDDCSHTNTESETGPGSEAWSFSR